MEAWRGRGEGRGPKGTPDEATTSISCPPPSLSLSSLSLSLASVAPRRHRIVYPPVPPLPASPSPPAPPPPSPPPTAHPTSPSSSAVPIHPCYLVTRILVSVVCTLRFINVIRLVNSNDVCRMHDILNTSRCVRSGTCSYSARQCVKYSPVQLSCLTYNIVTMVLNGTSLR